MKPEHLARLCRCGHARRFHQQGTIWQGYDTRCLKRHVLGDYAETGCLFFEAADSQIVTFRRNALGRFEKVGA